MDLAEAPGDLCVTLSYAKSGTWACLVFGVSEQPGRATSPVSCPPKSGLLQGLASEADELSPPSSCSLVRKTVLGTLHVNREAPLASGLDGFARG